MANERLRDAIVRQGLSLGELAREMGVDRKTVERWVNNERQPYRRHRIVLAQRLGLTEGYLWPGALSDAQVIEASESEVVTVYPHRWAVPREEWARLFDTAEHEIGVVVYSGLFLADDAGMHALLRRKAADGVRVRMLLGDPDSPHVQVRGEDEGIDAGMASKIRNVLVLYESLYEVAGIEFRLHDTVLYNSVYRADDELLVNTHVYGAPASQAPVLHLRQVSGGTMVSTYLDSMERIWARARPYGRPEDHGADGPPARDGE